MPLVKLFNLSLTQGKLPRDWKKAIVIPIHKKGSKTLAANYRPISLTCVACKAMEKIVNKRIINHLEANSLITSSHHGFRSKRSVDTNLLESYSLVTDLIEKGVPVDIILLYLAKAFDKVCHCYLIHRLCTLSLSPKVISWIEDFLRDRTQEVKVTNGPNSFALSDEVNVTSGVPQGSVLGPTLFNIYVNELVLITSNKTTLYADDSKLIGPANTPSARQSLQNDLNHMCSWVKRWLLEFNAEKCKVIHFGHSNPQQQYLMTLLESYSLVTDLIEKGVPVDIILLYLAKAFDKVCHCYLIHRLCTLSLSPKVISWIEDFLRDRTQEVKATNGPNSFALSDEVNVTSGVPQGSVLGPTLFNIYVNELVLITSNKTTLYADDSKLIGPANTPSTRQSLQNDLNHMCSWVKRWLLEFNAEKCKVIHFGHSNPQQQYLMTQNPGCHHILEYVQEERDLGVIVDSQLKFSSHSQKISANVSRALGIIKHGITSRSRHVITKFYEGLVRLCLEVGTILATP